MGRMLNLAVVESALRPVTEALEADGYTLEVSASENHGLRLEVIAGPEACEDCLVPKAMMERMVETALGGAGMTPLALEIVYPVDGRRLTSQ